MLNYHPIALRLDKEQVVIVGGGLVAERKVSSLLEANARIRLIAPRLTAQLSNLAKARRISWQKRRVSKKDISCARLVIAATDDKRVNEKVSFWAQQKNILVNVVDQPRLSTFISPAVLRKGKAIIAVYSDAKNPVLSRDLKNFLKEHWSEFLSYRYRL